MRKLWSKLLVAVLIGSLAFAPGCFLCKFRPEAQIISAKVDVIGQKFFYTANLINEMLAEAGQYPIDPAKIEMIRLWTKTAKEKVDNIYFNVLCPSEAQAKEVQDLATEAESKLADIGTEVTYHRIMKGRK